MTGPALPTPLRRGARVFVWAPSSPAPALYTRRRDRAVAALEACGYRVELGASCRRVTGPSTLPPKELAAELHDAVASPDVDGVLAAVGGWTLLPVLAELDVPQIVHAAKPLIGYSDIVTLLNVLASAGLVAFHGPMLLPEWGEHGGPWSYTLDMFRRVVSGDEDVVVPPAREWSDEVLWWDRDDSRRRRGEPGRGMRALQDGHGEGSLWGGTLRALTVLAGTPYWSVPDDAVIVVEDQAIAPDELWARLEQLRLVGAFDRARAVLVGRIGLPTTTASGFGDFDEIVRRVVPPGIPVVADLDLGHTEPMVTLPIGGRARVIADRGNVEIRLLAPFTAAR